MPTPVPEVESSTELHCLRVDVLVEFEPGHVPGFAFFDMQEELAGILGRRVDLHTPGCLSRYFRDRVVREAQDQHVAA